MRDLMRSTPPLLQAPLATPMKSKQPQRPHCLSCISTAPASTLVWRIISLIANDPLVGVTHLHYEPLARTDKARIERPV